MADARRLADVLAELHARRGYARVQATDGLCEAWAEAVGEKLARKTRSGAIKRGTLEVLAADSMIAQELQFQKKQILDRLTAALPDETIRDIRTKVGPIK